MTDLSFFLVISRIRIAAFDTKSCKLPLKWHCACAFHFGAQIASYLCSLRRVSQLVNKPLSAVYRRIISKAERLSKKWAVGRDAKLRWQMWNFEDSFSAEGIILRYTGKGKERDLFCFITFRLWRRHGDRKAKKRSHRYVHGFWKTVDSHKMSLSQKCM